MARPTLGFRAVWHLEPSLSDPDVVYAGWRTPRCSVPDDGGMTWNELPGLREHDTAGIWQPGAGTVPAYHHPRPDRPQPYLHRHLGAGVSHR